MTLIHIDRSLCACEGACIESCPYGLLERAEDGFPAEVEGAASRCIRCGHCVSVCPTGALTNAKLHLKDFQTVAELRATTDPLRLAMLTRRSVRAFKPDAVPREDLAALLEVARRAPTANNAQALWWIVTLHRGQTAPLARLAWDWMRGAYWPDTPASHWPRDYDPVLRGAPHLLLCCGPSESRWSATDAAIAVTHLDLLASARGLGVCWAGIFLRAAEAHPPLIEELALPPGQKAWGGLFLGYPKYAYRLAPPRKPCAVVWR